MRQPTTELLSHSEGRIAVSVKALLTTASLLWWGYLLWGVRNQLYVVPTGLLVLGTLTVSVAATWRLCGSGRRFPRRLGMTLIAVRGIGVATVTLCLLSATS